MNDDVPDCPEEAPAPAAIPYRYAALGLTEGVVIYDRENSEAWIQSDYAHELRLAH